MSMMVGISVHGREKTGWSWTILSTVIRLALLLKKQERTKWSSRELASVSRDLRIRELCNPKLGASSAGPVSVLSQTPGWWWGSTGLSLPTCNMGLSSSLATVEVSFMDKWEIFSRFIGRKHLWYAPAKSVRIEALRIQTDQCSHLWMF